MEVAYTLTLNDLVAFNLHLYKKTSMPRMPFQIALATVFFMVGSLGLAMSLVRPETFLVTAGFIMVLGLSTFPLTYPMYIAHQFRAYYKKLGTHGVTGPIKLILTDESLVGINTAGRCEVKWCDMLGVDEIDGYTFIRTTGVSAVVLPRTGFASEDEYFRTRDFAMARVGRKQGESIA